MQDSFQKTAFKEIKNLEEKLINAGFSVTTATKKEYNYEISVRNKNEQNDSNNK